MRHPDIASDLNWCVVVADDHALYAPGRTHSELDRAPIHYRSMGVSGTLLERALLRAARIAPQKQILLVASEECRELWEASCRFLTPARKFICAGRQVSQLALAAAVLHIAQRAPDALVTILPARCYVTQDLPLRSSLNAVREEIPRIEEGIVRLGMLDMDDPLDEDYLVVARPKSRPGLLASSFVRHPCPVVTRQLRGSGALVASQIVVGYAAALLTPLLERWLGLMQDLYEQMRGSGAEYTLNAHRQPQQPSWRVSRYSLWHPMLVPQRIFPVRGSGWSSLKSPRSIDRVLGFVSAAAALEVGRPSATRARHGGLALVRQA